MTTALQVQKLSSANGKPGKTYLTKAHYAFEGPGGLQTTVNVAPGVYSAAYQYVSTATGQETARTVIGNVGPITFAVTGEAPTPSSKKRAA